MCGCIVVVVWGGGGDVVRAVRVVSVVSVVVRDMFWVGSSAVVRSELVRSTYCGAVWNGW